MLDLPTQILQNIPQSDNFLTVFSGYRDKIHAWAYGCAHSKRNFCDTLSVSLGRDLILRTYGGEGGKKARTGWYNFSLKSQRSLCSGATE